MENEFIRRRAPLPHYAEAIRRGLVSVNSMEALKPDLLLEEKDKVVLRGSGRVILSEVGGSTRKDRIRVTYQVFR